MKTVILFLALLMNGLIPTGTDNGYDVGDVASDFKLKNIDGKLVSLSGYKKEKGVILIFDCNSCPVSKLYVNRIIELNKKYASLGFPVVAINSNDEVKSPEDSFDEMIKEAKTKGFIFPYLYDESQEIAKTYGATNTPHVFVLNNDNGTFKIAYIGAIDDNSRDGSKAKKKYVEEAVDAILKGDHVAVKKTKAIGCGIKWKDA